MKALIVRYMNEIVGLTVMALMAVALVAGQAGQAGAMRQDAVPSVPELDAAAAIVSFDEAMEAIVFRADIAINVGLDDLIRLDVDRDSIEAIRKVLAIRTERRD